MSSNRLLKIIYKYKKSSLGIGLALSVYLLSNYILSIKIIDEKYFHGFFQNWRILNDSTFSKSPIPLIYILTFVVLLSIGYNAYKRIISIQRSSFKEVIYQTIGFLAWTYFFFYSLWGINYHLPSLKERLHLQMLPLEDSLIYNEALAIQQTLNIIRTKITVDTQGIELVIPALEVEKKVRLSLTKVLSFWQLPTNGNVRVREIKPKGVLLRLATAGVYLPFVSEGQIDAGLPFLQKPSTLAHEMSHGYGITDEGECNFAGIMACINNDEQLIKYSGYIMYYRYLAYALIDNEPLFNKLKANLPPGLRQDLIQISNTLNKYPDIFPQFRNYIYDLYLRLNGVEEGIKSYGTVVSMSQAYIQKYGSLIIGQ